MSLYKCYFDISIDGKSAGRLIFRLRNDVVPETAENFYRLCIGDKGLTKKSKVPLHFKGTIFHRVIPKFMA